MFPFGDIMLPVIGLVALGLLIVGVKMFFLPQDARKTYEPVPEPSPAVEKQVEPVKPQSEKNATVQEKPKISKTTTERTPQGSEQVSKTATPVSQAESKPIIDEGGKPAEKTGIITVQEKQDMIAKPVQDDKATQTQVSQEKQDPVQQPVTKTGETGWGVQIGSFASRESADTLAKKVSSAGYNVSVTEATVSGKRYHRVTVIAGETRNSALEMEQKLKKEGYPTFVTSLK